MTLPAPETSQATPAPAPADRHRTDIQALRGMAILLVLLHHGRVLPWLKARHPTNGADA